MKFLTLLAAFTSIIVRQTSANSCLTLNSTQYGIPTLGANFTDYSYLLANEDSTFYYRLADLQLCTSSTGVLTGMRAVVVKVISPSNIIGAANALNRVGSVTEAGITCTNFTLDGTKNHFIGNLSISYTS
jgi:hypothetical protein